MSSNETIKALIVIHREPELGALLRGFLNEARLNGVSLKSVRYGQANIKGWRPQRVGASRLSKNFALEKPLSPRESKILELIGQGQSNKKIARELGIAAETVKSHIKHIFAKLKVEKRAQAVKRGQALKLISPERP